MQLTVRGKKFTGEKTIIMGILNVTPDSFSDGGKFMETDAAVTRALQMTSDGADIIDIGGESTRPGSERISPDVEISRILPAIRKLRENNSGVILSVDTYKAQVAEAALNAGADIINDISAGLMDHDMMRIVADKECPYIMMHMQGTPDTMQVNPVYSANGVMDDIKNFFISRINEALSAGIKKENIILDPGIGFGKTLEHNFEILDKLPELINMGYPVLMGTSRKSMIGKVLGKTADERLYGTIAAVVYSIIKGSCIVRVHDVKEAADAVRMTDAMLNYNPTSQVTTAGGRE